MLITVLHSKIHRATVTAADLHYQGSITIDQQLMQLAELLPYQQVQVYNISNGARFETYAIEGPAGSRCIQINGAAAHLARAGDLVIIAAYATMPRADAVAWRPRLVFVDDANHPVSAHQAAA